MSMQNRIQVARPHVNRNEHLIFERNSPGKVGVELAPLDVPAVSPEQVFGADMARDEITGFPEVSELEVIRHFTRLSTWNYGVDTGLYPLGSCTMKYNARINEKVARLLGIAGQHPYTPQALAQGCLRILHETSRCL
jgi:glycine dehydrogenase subunit 2